MPLCYSVAYYHFLLQSRFITVVASSLGLFTNTYTQKMYQLLAQRWPLSWHVFLLAGPYRRWRLSFEITDVWVLPKFQERSELSSNFDPSLLKVCMLLSCPEGCTPIHKGQTAGHVYLGLVISYIPESRFICWNCLKSISLLTGATPQDRFAC